MQPQSVDELLGLSGFDLPLHHGGREMEKSWKCTSCGYNMKDKEPPEECPACKGKCTFVDNIDYTQNIGEKRPDERI
jgi:rubredoxin